MIFTSYTYITFLIVAFLIHWSLPIRLRKTMLVIASFVFYCSWRWEYGFLLLAVCLFNWSYARFVLVKRPTEALLGLGILVNLIPLIYFKYMEFLLENAESLLNLFGNNWDFTVPNILLPLGISFFSFQGIAYLIDIACGDTPLEGFGDFLLFKSFWPQLIAGPIVRLHEIRDAIETPRTLDYDNVAYGLQRILYGLFKKVVIADSLASSVDMVYSSPTSPNFVDAVIGVFGFGLQIYFDFSAYSDIAIGSARLFGYVFPENFNFPYLSVSPQEFWQRWHMTLSRWIRDYVFTPLNFASRKRPWMANVWLLLAMALCGLWHGAKWTFVLWGVWHGALLVLNNTALKKVFAQTSNPGGRAFPWRHLPSLALTYVLVNLGWILFRSSNLTQCAQIFKSIVTLRGGLRPAILRENQILIFLLFWVGVVVLHLFYEPMTKALKRSAALVWSWWFLRPVLYVAILLAVIVFDSDAKTFVYFQF